MANATTSLITITELTGAKRTLTLRGAGLPKKGANYPGAQRVVTTWYAGNSAQASQHVLGPVERQSQWTGEWNTTRLITMAVTLRQDENDTAIVEADVVRQVFEDIWRGGSLLRVTWVNQLRDTVTGIPGDAASAPKKIVRDGRATEWDFQYATTDDITWTCTWDWIGRGQSAQKTLNADSVPDAGDMIRIANAYQSAFASIDRAKLVSANRTIPKSATKFSLGQLEALVDAPSKLMRDFARVGRLAVSRLRYLGDIVNKARNLPFEIANQAVDVANDAIASSNLFVDAMSRTPPEKMALQANVAMVTRNASYYSGTMQQANYVSTAAVRARTVYRANAQGDVTSTGEAGKGAPPARRTTGALGKQPPLAIYTAMEGDTLMSISVKFYGTDDGTFSIAFSNGLRATTTTVPVGRVLLIPQLNAGRARGLVPINVGKPPTAVSPRDPTLPGGITSAQGGGPAILPPGTRGP